MDTTNKHDAINHPKHYTAHPSGIECIQITEHMGFNLGNAIKYVWRADLKNDAIEDLRKAAWYIEREIAKRGGTEKTAVIGTFRQAVEGRAAYFADLVPAAMLEKVALAVRDEAYICMRAQDRHLVQAIDLAAIIASVREAA
jgi:hypothetical protein